MTSQKLINRRVHYYLYRPFTNLDNRSADSIASFIYKWKIFVGLTELVSQQQGMRSICVYNSLWEGFKKKNIRKHGENFKNIEKENNGNKTECRLSKLLICSLFLLSLVIFFKKFFYGHYFDHLEFTYSKFLEFQF